MRTTTTFTELLDPATQAEFELLRTELARVLRGLNLASTGVNSTTDTLTVNLTTLLKGAVTAQSTIAASGAVTGSNLSGTNTGDQTITLTGAVTGSGTGSFATTLTTQTAFALTTGGTTAGAVDTAARILKAVAGLADGVATAVLTVTVPNAAHSALLRLTLKGSLGAGGAVGANEATGVISYDVAIARTAGVNTVVTFSTGYGSATASVAGAATITVAAAASTLSGGSGATQTFTVNVTVTRGSGASTNHTCHVIAELVNANASGVTLT